MTPDDLKGLSQEDKFKLAGQFAGADVFKGIYQTESSGGKHLVSPAGALGPFQFMPSTTKAWSQRLGRQLDPMNFDDALTMAAYQIKENLASTHDVGDALRMYNSGTNRAKWTNPETTAYPDKVFKAQGMSVPASTYAQAPLDNQPDFVSLDPMDVLYGHKAPGPNDDTPKPVEVKPSQTQLNMMAVSGTTMPAQPDLGYEQARAQDAAAKAEQNDKAKGIVGKNRLGVEITEGSFLAKAAAAVDTTVTAAVAHSYDRLISGPTDPMFDKWKSSNIDQVRQDAQDSPTFDALLNARSKNEYDLILTQKRNAARLQEGARWSGAGEQTLYGLGAGVGADPIGAFANVVTDGAFSAAGVGGHSLMAAGQYGKGLAMHTTTGVIGNVSMTALLQASGQQESVNDYLMAGMTGGLLGLTGGGIDLATTNKAKLQLDSQTLDALEQASQELGPNVPAEQVVEHANKKLMAQPKQTYLDALYGESDHTFMPRDTEAVLLDTDTLKRKAALEEGNINEVDGTARNVKNEIKAQAKVIDASIKTDEKATKSPLFWLPGAESAGLSLTKSDNVVYRAVGKALVEVASGANGRATNAAMVKHVLFQRLLGDMAGWHDLESHYVQMEGYGLIKDPIKGDVGRKAFRNEVYYETLARGKGEHYTTNQTVLQAADMHERAMTRLAEIEKGTGTAGSARLPDSSVGYIQRQLSMEFFTKYLGKDINVENAIINAIAEQLSDPTMGNPRVRSKTGRIKGDVKEGSRNTQTAFDPDFAKKVAKRYLDHARDKLAGKGSGVGIDFRDPQAAQTLRDTLKAMADTGDASPEEIDKILGRFSRGGAAWTKARLNLDLLREIPDGRGGTMRLGDIFEKDVYELFRRRANRVSGEAALARHNIIGKAGIDMLRDAAIESGHDPKALKAFDQVMSEFIGSNVGNHGRGRIAIVDDFLVATGAARLGMASFNQLGEYSVAMNTIGLARTSQAIADVPRLLKEIDMLRKGKAVDSPILKTFDDLGVFIGGEDYADHSFFNGFNDIDVEIAGKENMSLFGRIARQGAKAQYILSGHRALVAAQTRGLAEQMLVRTFQFIREGKSDINLKDMGISDKLAANLRKNLDKIAEFDKSGKLIKLDAAHIDGPDLFELQVALHRGTGQMIQRTFVGETGPWVHDSVLKMLYQFRRVGIIAMEKQTVRDLSNKGVVKAFAGAMTGWALGIPIHAARVQAKSIGMSEDTRQKYLDRNLNPTALAFASMNYATKTGMLSDFAQVGTGTAAAIETNFNGATGQDGRAFNDLYSAISGGSRAGSRPFVGGTIAPAIGTVNDALSGKPGKMLRVLPGSQILAIQPFVNAIGANMENDDNK